MHKLFQLTETFEVAINSLLPECKIVGKNSQPGTDTNELIFSLSLDFDIPEFLKLFPGEFKPAIEVRLYVDMKHFGYDFELSYFYRNQKIEECEKFKFISTYYDGSEPFHNYLSAWSLNMLEDVIIKIKILSKEFDQIGSDIFKNKGKKPLHNRIVLNLSSEQNQLIDKEDRNNLLKIMLND